MKVTVLCNDPEHPVNAVLKKWIGQVGEVYNIDLVRSRSELSGGDFLFLVSCSEVINSQYRAMYKHTLVLHASNLPEGRGWSPHIWELINGRESITLSLLEAEDKVDSGRLWLQRSIPVSKTALWYEVNQLLFEAEVDLINEAVERHREIEPHDQRKDIDPTYYPRRTATDSEVDPYKTIAGQFDLIRMCDPQRYPAWFDYLGQKYRITLEKIDDDQD